MTTLLLTALVLTAIGSVVTLLAVRHAPEGYEDETGFHGVSTTGSTVPAEVHSDHFAGGLA